MAAREPRLRLAVSACLLGQPVRWDGTGRAEPLITQDLAEDFELVAVCPEQELGLGVPRPPIQLERAGTEYRLRSVADGHDLSAAMDAFAGQRLGAPDLQNVRGFILKARSPSCGLGTTPVLERGRIVAKTNGRFAAVVRARWPNLPVIDEDQLRDPVSRARFLAEVRRG